MQSADRYLREGTGWDGMRGLRLNSGGKGRVSTEQNDDIRRRKRRLSERKRDEKVLRMVYDV
jgi:hypothetical protein